VSLQSAAILKPQDLPALSTRELLALVHSWDLWARPEQLPPDHPSSSLYNPDDPNTEWDIWIALAGRGFGKTRMGAEQILRWVDQGHRRIHMIAPTTADTRDVMVEGDSGILACAHPDKRPLYEPSKRRLTFPNGAIALLFSAEEPERLRGPQCDCLWADELAAWQYVQETWDQAMFGLRLGQHPQMVITTTPKPLPLVRQLIEQSKQDPKGVVITYGSTYDNKANLAKSFFRKIAQYEGTRLGDQELHAKMIDPNESSIVKKSWLKLFPHSIDLPQFEYILQSYDTAYTDKTLDKKSKDPDPSAQTTWGVFKLTLQMKRSLSLPEATPYQYGVLLLDAWTDHLGYPELRIKVAKEYDQSTFNERRVDTVLIEDKGSGISLRQDLGRVIPVHAFNPGKADKTQRLHAVSYIPCAGIVFIPESRSFPGKTITWADEFIEQLCSFPLVEHDDYVDTTSQAWQYLRDLGYLSIDVSSADDEEFDDYIENKRKNPYSR